MRLINPRGALVGTRLAALGTIVYFLEWVAIIGAGGIDVFGAPGQPASQVLSAYAGHSNVYGWAAGWFGVVLLGRVLYAAALRNSLRRSGWDDALADFGVLAMTAGVLIEMASYGVVAATAILADHGARADTVSMLDVLGGSLNTLLWGATGAGVVSLAVAMLRSELFHRALSYAGVVAGIALTVQGLAFSGPNFKAVQGALQGVAFLFWIWMIWTSIVLWRAGRRDGPQASHEAASR